MEENLTKKEKRELKKKEKQAARQKEASFEKVKKIGIWGVSLILLVFLGGKFVNWIKTPVSVETQTIEITEADWIKGNPEAPLTLVEYGDFQCPACGIYAPLVRDLLKEMPNDLRVVYRHFPLVSIHPNAFGAARAAEAAGNQGKFWEMHDILFEKQSEWSETSSAKDKFKEYANSLGLNEEVFLKDFESKEVEEKIENQLFSGNQLGVNATPSFFLNGKKLVNPGDFNSFKALLEQSL